MSEGGVSGLVEKYTGADVHAWGRRLGDFLTNPERREVMAEKLVNALRVMMKRKENEEQARLYLIRSENDVSGLRTDFWGNGEDRKASIGIGILPDGVRVNEILIDEKATGPAVLRKLNTEDSANYHLIATTPLAEMADSRSEWAVLGMWKNGDEKHAIVDKNPGKNTNEYESGGVAMGGGKFEVMTKMELSEAGQKFETVNQTVFTAGGHSWREIAKLPAYKDRFIPIVGIGYWIRENGERVNFTICDYADADRPGIFGTLNTIDGYCKSGNFTDWRFACVDTGGHFAGMIRSDQDGEVMVGPSVIKGDGKFYDAGHARKQFWDFSWPKK